MNQAPGHLTDAQIQGHVANLPTDPAAQKWLEAHLADCESCLDRLLDAERIHLGLQEGDGMKQAPHPGCPADKTLQELAAGICAADTAATTTEHAAHCNYCGPQLGRYLREFSDDSQGEDAVLLRQLETSTSRWQKKFVREHMAGRKQKSQGWFSGWWPRLATATAGLAIAAGLFFYIRRPDDLRQAQQLVAAAYGERRTTEMRLPATPYGHYQPVPVVKGSSDGNDWESAPAPLVEAEGIIKKNKAADTSSQWLDVQGRVDLLQGSAANVDRSIEAFEGALAKNPQNLELKVDLAAAYFEKEMLADRDRPVLVKTIDLLEDVVKNAKKEDQQLKATALFNLAIAYEKSEMLDVAASTWEQYLAMDSSSDWAGEARKHLQDLKGREPPRAEKGHETPAYFLSHAADPAILNDLEEYQEIALTKWLPAAIRDNTSDSAASIRKLASLLEQEHADRWLRDLIAASTVDEEAADLLAAAISDNANDLHQRAIRESQQAEVLFIRDRNLPGELGAGFEEVYGLQRALSGRDCLQHAEQLDNKVSLTGYHWLRGQLALEKATCANLNSNPLMASANVEISRSIADEFQYAELALRVTGVEAGMRRLRGQYTQAWQETVQGLHGYWNAHHSWERLYQFYSVMRQCARDMGALHAARALSMQGIAIVENNAPDDASLKAMLYLRLANTLRAQNENSLADVESAKAASLLKTVSDVTAQEYALLTQIEFAELQLQQGKAERALSAFTSLGDLLQTQHDFVKFDVYTLQGEIYQRLSRFQDSVSAYVNSVQIAERSTGHNSDEASRLDWTVETGKAYRGLTRSLLELGRERDALSVWEHFQSRALKAGGSDHGEPRPPGSQSFFWPLPPVSQPHLVYASFEDGLQIWLVTGSAIQGKWIPVKQDDLQQQVREFARQCANPSLSPEAGLQLYSLMLQPVISDLPATGPVAIELDESLWGLTFEALRDPQGRYFAADHAVVYSPGLLAEDALRQVTPLTLRDPMLLVDAAQSRGVPLPGHSEEVAAVKNTFAKTKILGPGNVTREEIDQALAHSSELHFTGHGRPDGSGTVLVIGSGFLEAKDFSREWLGRLQLVVLSACSSGSARKGAFDQSSLVRSFLSGGVPTVIASRWDVDSRSTAHFMQTFYARLRTGEAPSQALRYAEADMRSVNSHPYYWAAFALTGRVN